MSDLPPPLPEQPQGGNMDSRMRAFLRRAGPVIATERGLNESARVKLRAIAADMKLPDSMFDEAISTLQNQPPVVKRELTRYEAAFEKSMRGKMQSIPRGILTARIENRAVDIAREKYQLSELQAREILRSLVGELNLQRISVTQSERHMEATIEDLIGEQTYATEETRTRLVEFGKGMGLGREHVEAMIRHYVDLNLLNQKKEGTFVKVVGLVVVVTLLSLGGLLAYSLTSAKRQPDVTVVDESAIRTEIEPEIISAGFWDDRLELSVMHVGRINTDFASIRDQIASEDVENRIVGYRNLIKSLPDLTGSEQMRKHTGSALRGLIRLEPDESAARILLGEISNEAVFDEESLPIDVAFMARSEWLLDQMVAARNETDASDLRGAVIAEELFKLTGRENANGKLQTKQRAFRALLLESLLQRLAGMAGEQPDESIKSFPIVFGRTTGVVQDSRRIELSAGFLQAAIEPANENWKELDDAISWTVMRATPEQLVQFISQYESLSNEAAQRFLGKCLVDRIDIPESTEPSEIAAYFRLKLGIEEPAGLAVEKKRTEFIAGARALRTSVEPAKKDPAVVSADIVRVAWWTTFASYLRRSDTESPDFKQLIKIGPPEGRLTRSYVASSGGGDPDESEPKVGEIGGGRVPNSVLRDLGVVGRNFKRKNTQQRVEALRRIASSGHELENAPIKLATGFAYYLLTEKRAEEQREAILALRQVAHWPALLIGVADSMQGSNLVIEKQPLVIGELIDVPAMTDEIETWRAAVRAELLTKALDGYRRFGVLAPVDTELSYNYLQTLLQRLTRQRALNFGVSPSLLPADAPLETILKQWYLHTSESSVADANGAASVEARRKVDSAGFLGESPLQKVVLYQQLLIEELRRNTVSKAVWSKPATLERLKELELKQQQADTVFQQMLCNELMLMELMLAESLSKS